MAINHRLTSPLDTDSSTGSFSPRQSHTMDGDQSRSAHSHVPLINRLLDYNLRLSDEKNTLVSDRAEMVIAKHKLETESEFRQLRDELEQQRQVNHELAFQLERRVPDPEEQQEDLEYKAPIRDEVEDLPVDRNTADSRAQCYEVQQQEPTHETTIEGENEEATECWNPNDDEFEEDYKSFYTANKDQDDSDNHSTSSFFIQPDENLDADSPQPQPEQYLTEDGERHPFVSEVLAMFPSYRFTPVICFDDRGSPELGKIEDLSAEVMRSLLESLELYQDRRECLSMQSVTTVPDSTVSCGYLWMFGTTSNRAWTIEKPRQFACKTCFNRRRVCFYHQGDGEWIILPLPPEVRGSSVNHCETGYYIHVGQEKHASFPGVWAETRKQKRKRSEADG